MEKTTIMKNTNQTGTPPMTLLGNLRTNVESREQLGVLLIDYLLREAATGKHFRQDGVAEIPLTATFTVHQNLIETDTQVCGSWCLSTLGTNIMCIQVCHTEHLQ